MTRHHARLRRRDPEATLHLCRECHKAIHGLYPGTRLVRRPDLWTLEGLRADAAMMKAVEHIRKLPPGTSMRMRERRGVGR